MDKKKPTLTDAYVTKIKPPTEGQEIHWDGDPRNPGFGLVVGKSGVKTFVAQARVNGNKERVKIGLFGAPFTGGLGADDAKYAGHTWNVSLAHTRYKILVGDMAKGISPNALKNAARKSDSKPGSKGGPTLREGRDAHLAFMKKKQRAAASIRTYEYETEKYLGSLLDRPFADLTGTVLSEFYEEIKKNARTKGNRNTRNVKGAYLANRVLTHISAAFNRLNKSLNGSLGNWNPAKAVDRDTTKGKRERLTDIANWYARVQTMKNPIQKDGLVLALFTGLRSEDVRSIRWEHVDFDEETLHMPDPKGGEDAAFDIPLSPTALEILERRKKENAASEMFAPYGGDGGYAFPTILSDDKVGPIADLRAQVKAKDGKKHSRFPTEDVHSLRRTFLSVAAEEKISEIDQHVLTNHSFGNHNVNAGYISQHMDHLKRCAAKIDSALQDHIKGKTKPAKKARLRSVP